MPDMNTNIDIATKSEPSNNLEKLNTEKRELQFKLSMLSFAMFHLSKEVVEAIDRKDKPRADALYVNHKIMENLSKEFLYELTKLEKRIELIKSCFNT